MELFFRTLGEGQPFVILHGLFGMSDNWQAVAKQLSTNYEVFLIDQRNHGKSGWDEEWDYKVMADDLKEFIENHQLQNPILLGHSMGGKTLMHFVMSYPPELYEKAIVVDISPKSYPIHHDHIIEALLSVDLSKTKSRKEADEQLARHLAIPPIRQFLLKNLYRIQEGSYAWRMNLKLINKKIINIGEGLAQDFKGESLEKEVLFIRGGLSDYILEDDFDLIYEFFPQAKIETVEKAGHWVHAQQPKILLEKIHAFLDK